MSPSLQNTIASTGSLQAAIAQLQNEACGAFWNASVHAVLREALAVQSAEQEAVDPALKARRLRMAAADKHHAAAKHMAAEANFAGMATHRHNRGEHELARRYEISAKADLNCAMKLLTEAEAMEAEAAALERRARFAAEVVAHLEAAE